MKAKKVALDDLKMSSSEFDRIMGKALQVKPKEAGKSARAKKNAKKKPARK